MSVIKTGRLAITGIGVPECLLAALELGLHPVTHAIGNTMRRVVIMLVCIGVFGTPMTPLAAMGSVLAIGGSFLYSMVKAEEKRKAKEAVLDAKLATALPLKVDAEKKAE